MIKKIIERHRKNISRTMILCAIELYEKKKKIKKKILFNTVKRYFQDLVNFCDQSWITAD